MAFIRERGKSMDTDTALKQMEDAADNYFGRSGRTKYDAKDVLDLCAKIKAEFADIVRFNLKGADTASAVVDKADSVSEDILWDVHELEAELQEA